VFTFTSTFNVVSVSVRIQLRRFSLSLSFLTAVLLQPAERPESKRRRRRALKAVVEVEERRPWRRQCGTENISELLD
jgi:hypothetical protein